ncbi:MAG: hypothetical protein ACE5J9_00255 [Methanosarcinales archaeon]
MGYLVKIDKDKTEIVIPKFFDKEEILRDIVKKYPEIIPLEEIDENFESLLIIGREFSLAGAGSIDLLAIDASGLITIIELKLERNTDIRKSIAQVIEYAANLWEMSYDVLDKKVQDYFKCQECAIKELKNKTLVQAVRWHFEKTKRDSDEIKFDSEEFIKNVSGNLQKGEFRLIIFCDNVDMRTKRAVEYLNFLSSFDIFCVSTNAYEVDGNFYFKSSIITSDRNKALSGKKRAGKITFEEFLDSVPKEYREIYSYFDEKKEEINVSYSLGTKGFSAYFQFGDNKIRLFEAYPSYILLITKNFIDKYVNKDKITISQDALDDYEAKLSEIKNFRDSFKSARIFSFHKYSKMKSLELKEYFDFITDWYKRWFMKERE